jgi:hypothetical protein
MATSPTPMIWYSQLDHAIDFEPPTATLNTGAEDAEVMLLLGLKVKCMYGE